MPTNRIDIYDYEKTFRRAAERLKSDPNICEENKQNIRKFTKHLLVRGISKPRVIKYINPFRNVNTEWLSAQIVKKKFLEVTLYTVTCVELPSAKNTEPPEWNNISTSKEPVGEEET